MDTITPEKIHALFDKASPEIQEFLLGDEVNRASAILGKLYALPITKYIPLKNVITFLLLGAIEPKDAVIALQKNLNIDEDTAYKLGEDLDKTVLQKVRLSVLGETKGEVKVLKVGDETNKDELRKAILDTTKRESAVEVSPVKPEDKRPKKIIVQGSRNQLIEQLNLLGTIPDDDEIKSRLEHIRGQIKTIEGPVEEVKPISKELENALSGGGQTVVVPKIRAASYSVAPTSYNIDPYREVPAE